MQYLFLLLNIKMHQLSASPNKAHVQWALGPLVHLIKTGIAIAQEYKVKGIPNGILKILQEKVKTNFGAFGYYFPQIYDCSLL